MHYALTTSNMSQPTPPLVTVGVCTYKRPEGIAKCLRSLIDQQTSIPFDIVVTENDALQGSKSVIEQIADEAKEKGIEIRYYCEPEPNIAIARNRCVTECRGEFLAFIDDDEWAEPNWLEKLVEVQREYNADAVWGSVIQHYEPDFPEYLKNLSDINGLFQEGQKLESVSTNSTMYRYSLLQTREGPFDKSWGRTGGEDSDLAFYLFQKKNALMIKTFKAEVHEANPPSRAKYSFYWKRRYRESMVAARLFDKYYFRLMGLKVNGIHVLTAISSLLFRLLLLPFSPRRSFISIGLSVATIMGTVGYYLGFDNFKYN